MDINYFPGRIRIRDKIFRDQDIRLAFLEIAEAFDAGQKITFNEKTASILIEYDASKIDEDKFKSLEPLVQKYRSAILFYDKRKKGEILAGIEEVKAAVKSWG
ncbi:MAG: hypothetical protein J6X11_01650 [Treponema sp.]|nr:hypothetical protein [Treponema sp.]MBR4386702.1 hypothetical protein [Treponema sp.]